MTSVGAPGGNFDLKEEIRSYWSDRSETFDLSAEHRIAHGAEARAWADEIRERLGARPLRILEFACGTGEITGVLHGLGHDVTALDFSKAMLARARAKHAGKPRLRFVLADAENTMELDADFDAVVCRQLVWTLTDPAATFADWRRVLKPGGTLLIFDGDWATPTPVGRIAKAILGVLDRWLGDDATHHAGMPARHDAIMRLLPFAHGLTQERLLPLLAKAGFVDAAARSQSRVASAQRQGGPLRDRLRTLVYCRFAASARVE